MCYLTKVTWVVLLGFIWSLNSLADIAGEVKLHDRVGNGWHMDSTITVSDSGLIDGETTLRNYNNVRGFTGGLRVTVLGENNTPIYVSQVHAWGINAAFFKKEKTRTVKWTEQIPAEYLNSATGISVIQEHSPTNRVWKWLAENKDIILANAKNFIEIIAKLKGHEPITADDIWQATYDVVMLLNEVENDSWVLENLDDIYNISYEIYQLAQKDKEGWIPENFDEAEAFVLSVIDLTKKPINWDSIDDIEVLVKELCALIGDKQGWIPENLQDVEYIVEDLYVMLNDDVVPVKIRQSIQAVLEKLQKLNS